jgi:hypothetical protein
MNLTDLLKKRLSQEEPIGRKLWNGLYKELIKIHKFRTDFFFYVTSS